MIGLLTGKVYRNHKNPIILWVNGVGYSVYVPEQLRTKITKNQDVTLFIHTHVSDDAIALFGFSTEDELTIFDLLLSVSGIGPRTALAILDRGAQGTEKAIMESDVDFFTAIPRLGKKNAQKIIIELKSKLGSIRDLDLKGEVDSETKELQEALLSMGFVKKEILEAIKKLDDSDKSVEQKLRHALKILGK